MAKNTASRILGAKPLIERAEIMAVARGVKKTGNTKCETNILQNRKVGKTVMTNQQAMKLLEEQKNGFLDEFIDYSGIVEAYNMGIRALETTTRKIEFDSIHCAACGRRLKYDAKFCDQCGRKIEAK